MESLEVGSLGRVLLYGPTWIGDTVMATPLLVSLRRALPGARLEALTPPWCRGLLEGSPYLEEVIVPKGTGGSPQPTLSEWLKTALSLRKRRYDLAILLPNSFKAALVARLAGARRRLGYATGGRAFLLTHAVPPPSGDEPPHLVDCYLGLLEAMGLEPSFREPTLTVSPEAAAFAEGLWRELGLGEEEVVVGLNPGAFFGASKMWLPEFYGQLAVKLYEEMGARVLLLGGRAEVPVAEGISQLSGRRALSIAGRDTLSTLPAILKRLDALVSGDTGPLHIAAAVGTPVVALFGPTDPRRTAPRGRVGVVIRRDLECSPCFDRECSTDHRCMREIGAEEVFRAVAGVLRRGAGLRP